MSKMNYVFQLSANYIAWICCILLAANGYGLMGAVVVMLVVFLQIYWQFKIQKNTYGLFSFIFLITCIGSIVDTIFLWMGMIVFSSNHLNPYFTSLWMVSIWISFAVVMFSTLFGLFSRYFLMGLFAFFGFSIAYAVGAKMGAAIFPYGFLTAPLIGSVWAFLLPLTLYVYQRTLK